MRSIIVAFLVLGTAHAQLSVVAGPAVAPIGCPFVIGVSNDTTIPHDIAACVFVIRDAAGNIVTPNNCAGVVFSVNPGATLTFLWPQVDAAGLPLPPGPYTVEVSVLGTLTVIPVVIGGVDAASALHGAPRVGTQRNIQFCSPLDAGFPYLAGASLSSAGIQSCGGIVPLAFDPLLAFSLDPANSVFVNFSGTLDATGMTTAPALALPNLPAFIGASFVVAFIVVDTSAACPIRRIAAPLVVTIV